MVLGDQHHVLHARLLGEARPSIRIIFHRVKLLVIIIVHWIRGARPMPVNIPRPVGLAAPANFLLPHRTGSPVNEHPELRITKPLHALVALSLGLVYLWHSTQILEAIQRWCLKDRLIRRHTTGDEPQLKQ